MPVYRSTQQVPNTANARRVAHERVGLLFFHLAGLGDLSCTEYHFDFTERRVYVTITGDVIQQKYLDEHGLEVAP